MIQFARLCRSRRGSGLEAVLLLSVLYLCAFCKPAPAAVRGDVNEDGKIDVVDATRQLQIATGLAVPTWVQWAVGDVNGDGWVNHHDAVMNLQIAVGLRAPQTALPIVFDGNSLTRGCCLGTAHSINYPLQLQRMLGGQYVPYNFSVSGQTTGDMIRDAALQIDSLRLLPDGDAPRIVVVWEGTNDLYFGASGAEAYQRLKSYSLDRKRAGYRVVILTVLPRNVPHAQRTFETHRQEVNRLLRSEWRDYADALADVAADHRIGDDGDQIDLAYFHDGIHMTEAGYAAVAEVVRDRIVTLL